MNRTPPIPPLTTAAEALVWELDGPDGADRRFRHEFFRNLPRRLGMPIARTYRARYESQGRQSANLYLLDFKELKKQCPVPFDTSDHDIRELAKRKADTCFDLVFRHRSRHKGFRAASAFARAWGARPPAIGGSVTLAGASNRLCDAGWWRRKLRRFAGKKLEQLAITAGLVNRRAGIYTSDESVARRREAKQRNRALLEELKAVSDDGEEHPLTDLIDRSVSNPRVRRSELMARIAGFERYAQENGHVGELYTLTCPSRMHPRLSQSGNENPRFDGTTPEKAQRYLTTQWAKARAALHRANISVYGFRIAEPHHDGTPHWHLLLFMSPEDASSVRMVLRHYALEHDGDEPGADTRRFTVVAIDWSRGTATGYVAKYVSKNIDGYGLDEDDYGHNAQDSATRVEAWATLWSIRQFQQVGGPPVTTWRELRRLGEPPPGILGEAARAADDGDWARYVEVMGGTQARRADHPVRVVVLWSDRPNRYDEPEGYRISGVEARGQFAGTRQRQWTIQRTETANSDGAGPVPEPGLAPLRNPGRTVTEPDPARAGDFGSFGDCPGPSRYGTGTSPGLPKYEPSLGSGTGTGSGSGYSRPGSGSGSKNSETGSKLFRPLEFCQ